MEKCILVCVTVQRGCVELIRRGHEMALQTGAELHVLHVSGSKTLPGQKENAEILDMLFSLARETDAEMSVLYEERDVAAAIARQAKELGATTLILGQNRTGIVEKVRLLLPEGTALISIAP